LARRFSLNSSRKNFPEKKILFVFGTDTGVGKTKICEILVKGFKELGINAIPFKPVETGHSRAEKTSDAYKLSQACPNLSLEETSYLLFKKPVAPVLAAELEGRKIKMEEIISVIKERTEKGEILIVEGAGGIFSPISRRFDWLDIVKALRGEVVIVIGNKLGAINHAILSEKAVIQRKVKLTGWILNNLSKKKELAQKTNLFLLKKFMESPFICEVPFLKGEPSKTFCKKVAEKLITFF
jgi:dethiobiotin synthetase